jgi:hypothetical protein
MRNVIVKPANSYTPNPLLRLLKKSLRGYKQSAKRALWIAAALAAVGISAFVLVFPLWYVSSHYRNQYTGFSLLLIFLSILVVVTRKILSEIRRAGNFRRFAVQSLLPAAGKTAAYLAAAAGLYGVVLLFARNHIPTGMAAAALLALFLGFLLSVRDESK